MSAPVSAPTSCCVGGDLIVKRAIATSAAACGLCVGLLLPMSPASAAAPVFDASVATPGTSFTGHVDVLGKWVDGPLDDAFVVVVPGTDDDRSPRIDGIVGDRESAIVTYPESFWPIISGKSGKLLPLFAPTYDASREVGRANSLAVMEALSGVDRTVVYTGFSQGSDALGNAAEQAAREGWLGAGDTILLVSDPRGPWGVKSQLDRVPLADQLLGLIGVTGDGARNPADTGDAEVVHVIVQGDPAAHLQWVWYRPIASAVVNAAGFIAIHSDTGPYTYAHLENLDHVKTLKSVDGNSTYEIYDTYHPLALLNAMIHRALGLSVSTRQLERWDRMAEAFYPTQEITADNADPRIGVVEAPLSSQPETGGRHRLLGDDGEWAEPIPLEGAASSPGPRHAAPETEPGVSEAPSTVETSAPVPTETGPTASAPPASGVPESGTLESGAPESGTPESDAPSRGGEAPATEPALQGPTLHEPTQQGPSGAEPETSAGTAVDGPVPAAA